MERFPLSAARTIAVVHLKGEVTFQQLKNVFFPSMDDLFLQQDLLSIVWEAHPSDWLFWHPGNNSSLNVIDYEIADD